MGTHVIFEWAENWQNFLGYHNSTDNEDVASNLQVW